MKQTYIMIALAFFYTALGGSALIDHEWNKALYWAGALLILASVWGMKG